MGFNSGFKGLMWRGMDKTVINSFERNWKSMKPITITPPAPPMLRLWRTYCPKRNSVHSHLLDKLQVSQYHRMCNCMTIFYTHNTQVRFMTYSHLHTKFHTYESVFHETDIKPVCKWYFLKTGMFFFHILQKKKFPREMFHVFQKSRVI